MPIDKVAHGGLKYSPKSIKFKSVNQRGLMTPTTKNQLPNEAELLEIEQDLDTEDFLLEDLYELSGTEDSEWLESCGMGTDEDYNFAFGICDDF